MDDAKRILESFIDMGDKHYFELKNGRRYQGYLTDIEGNQLRMWDSGPMAAEEQLAVPIADIDLNTLAYWDEQRRTWINARWNEHERRWTHVDDKERRPTAGEQGAAHDRSYMAKIRATLVRLLFR